MKKTNTLGKLTACLLGAILVPSTSPAHTEAIGYETLGGGNLNVWFGTYHGFGQSPTFEGQAQLTTPSGSILNVPFSLSTGVRPAGLIDGVNIVYAPGYSAGDFNAWQGVLFTGLTQNGHYTIGYDPAVPLNSSKWANDFGGTVGLDIVGVVPAAPAAVAAPVSLLVVDLGAIESLFESGLPLAVAQRELLLNAMQTATRDVGARLFQLRAGLSLGENGPAGAAGPVGREAVRLGIDGKTVHEAKDGKSAPEDPFRHIQLFAMGDFGAFDVNDTGSLAGYGSDVWVGTVGAEYRFNQNLAVGAAASYVNSDTEISRGIGGVDVEGVAFSAYGSAVWRDFYFDLLYSFGVLDEDISRHTLVGRMAHGNAENRNHALEFNGGYTFQLGALRTGPLATVKWVHGDLDGYRERGGGTAALEFPSQNFDSLISRFGWQVSYTAPTRFGSLTPQLRASWDHEYLDSADAVSASLLQTPFTTIAGSTITKGDRFSAATQTAKPGRDYLSLGAGLAAQLGDRVTASLEYETHLFQAGASAHLGSVKIAISF